MFSLTKGLLVDDGGLRGEGGFSRVPGCQEGGSGRILRYKKSYSYRKGFGSLCF